MKSTIFAFALLATGFCLGFAQDGKPAIKFEKDLFDFGDIDKGKKVTTSFKFTNTGDAPLEIRNVATSCGCTSADLDKKNYNPGESGEIPVTFDSERFSGPITKRVTITTNDPDSPKTVVTIKGTVKVDIMSKPVSLFFANAKMGEQSEQKIMVSTDKLAKLEISNLKVQPDFLSAKVNQVDDKTAEIIVTADGAKFPEGKPRLAGSLTYDTNSESQKTVRTQVTINVLRPIRVSPNSVYFFASKLGKKRESYLRLISSEGQEFKISDIESSLAYIDVKVTEDNGKAKSLMVTLADNAPEGKFDGKISIATSIKEQSEVVIPVRGSVIK